MFQGKYKLILLSGAVALSLSACQTTSSTMSQEQQLDAALNKAAAQAQEQGNTAQSLSILEKIYKRDPQNLDNAVNYASSLRQNDRLNKAAIVLTPFVNGSETDNAALQTEYAAIQAAIGSYSLAEEHAAKATKLDETNGEAFHILGVALDAQGEHKAAEAAFTKALDNWSGNPAPVLNNLGLNLAAQGFLDRAMDTLRKAEAVSPNRQEIERNMRIVSALQGSVYRAPEPDGNE